MPLELQNDFSRHPLLKNGDPGKIPRKWKANAKKGKGLRLWLC